MSTSEHNDQPKDKASKPQDKPGQPEDEILGKIMGLPIYLWEYRRTPSGERHIGLSPKEFRAAFGVGGSDEQIELTDVVGVLMAAIYRLGHKTANYLDAELAKRDLYITQLEGRIRVLEEKVRSVLN